MSLGAILLVEDDDLFRKPLRLQLERMGYDVTEAHEGAEALRLYRTGEFDLVITDLVMPGKEGLETIRELRASDPQVKIIAMSGGGRLDPGDYLPMARAFGAAKVLAKPFECEELAAAIHALLGKPS